MVATAILIVYFSGSWYAVGRTVGQAAVRVTVVRAADGGRLQPWQALVRGMWFWGPWAAGILSGGLMFLLGLVSILGLLAVAWDTRKQGWHDRTARTFAVRRWP